MSEQVFYTDPGLRVGGARNVQHGVQSTRSQRTNLRKDVARVVHDLGSAETAYELCLLPWASGGYDACASGGCELHGHGANTTARGRNVQPLPFQRLHGRNRLQRRCPGKPKDAGEDHVERLGAMGNA